MKRFIAILLTTLLFAYTAKANNECLCNSPIEVLEHYYFALSNDDDNKILRIYWGAESFNIPEPIIVKSYSVKKKEVLLMDQGNKFKDMVIDEIPLWAKKWTVQMEVEQVFGNGEIEMYFYAFREIQGKWYMVGHSSFNQPE